MKGFGCATCYHASRFSTKEEFILKSKDKFGEDEFNYSLVEYENCKSHVKLIHKCGQLLLQTPMYHLSTINDSIHYCNKCQTYDGYKAKRGYYFSSKMNVFVNYHSGWKKRRMQELDKDFHIISWRRCLDKIEYFDTKQNKNRTYYPDFEITLKDKIIIEEIKGVFCQTTKAKAIAALDFYKNQDYVILTFDKNNKWRKISIFEEPIINDIYRHKSIIRY